MWSKKNLLVYLVLLTAWLAFAGWQYHEHQRYEEFIKSAERDRSQDRATTFGVVIRSISRFGVAHREFMQTALEDLAETAEGVALYTPEGQKIIAAGQSFDVPADKLVNGQEWWLPNSLVTVSQLQIGDETPPRLPPAERDRRRDMRDRREEGDGPDRFRRWDGPPPTQPTTRNAVDEDSFDRRAPRDGFSRRPEGSDPATSPTALRRPSWMSEEAFAQLMRLQGPHFLAINTSTASIIASVRQDKFMRLSLVFIALVAALGLAAAWLAASRSMDLQVRLARAQETNKMLREMNLAAAGLAHETRNPLNLVRGMAQIINKEAPGPEIRTRAQNIINEVDRVSSRLNEFLDYSKPRSAHLAPTNLKHVVGDVANALETDLEDKRVLLTIEGPDVEVQADEVLLRQVIFNLLLNALQAVPERGRVMVAIVPQANREVLLEVRDDGPGVPPESQEEIFRPYFTLRPEGTGLGLAVVRQFVVAHQWEIKYQFQEGLSVFRISGVRLAS